MAGCLERRLSSRLGAYRAGADANDGPPGGAWVEHGIELDHPVDLGERHLEALADGFHYPLRQESVDLLRLKQRRDELQTALGSVAAKDRAKQGQVRGGALAHSFVFISGGEADPLGRPRTRSHRGAWALPMAVRQARRLPNWDR